MKYINKGFKLESDVSIRTIREEGTDIDLIAHIDDRTVNLHFDDIPHYIKGRLQFPLVKNIIIRISTLENLNTCTIHLLRSIDIHSSVVNFEVDYTNHYIYIINSEYCCELKIIKKN